MSEDKHIEVQVLAPAKGSNPGVIGTIGPRKYHIKYCNRSNIKGTPLTVAHQPIYEALTAELARMLGLKTPNCGVLQDKGNLSFVKMPVYDGQIPAGREFYFTSELVRPTDVDIDQSEIEKMLAQEEIYNKFLMIGDNSGSKGNRDNFVLVGKDPKICYVDFGCSYVHCVGGAMTLKNAVKKMRLDKRQLTRNRKTLGQRVLEDNNGVFVNLGQFIDRIPDVYIDRHVDKVAVGDLLSKEEIAYIQGVHNINMTEQLRKYKDDERIDVVN